MEQLAVWAEWPEGFVQVGMLAIESPSSEWFEYSPAYLQRKHAVPIYPILPLREGRFTSTETRAAFSSLGPEGRVGHEIRTALRAGREAVAPVLARLNHETVGALTFTSPDSVPSYEDSSFKKMQPSFFEEFANAPERIAFDTLMQSRLSLNGAVSKLGLALRDGAWYMPEGLEPSTHILKAGSVAFPNQMLNEALCMRCAAACGFEDAAETSLIVVKNAEPLLVSKRFDRTIDADRPQGLPPVMRLHQADLCQILGISVDSLKYTPSDELIEGYNTRVADAILHESSERYGDRVYVFETYVFNYLIGNCDNHLKNLSLTWKQDWSGKSVSPVYDLTCTTIYPELSRDMGLGIGRHRSIDDVDVEDFSLLAQQMGIGAAQSKQSLGELFATFPTALMEASHQLEDEYGVKAEELARWIASDAASRLETVGRAAMN